MQTDRYWQTPTLNLWGAEVCLHDSNIYLKYFVQLFLILHHNDVGLAVVSHKVTGFRVIRCVDPSCQTSVHNTYIQCTQEL